MKDEVYEQCVDCRWMVKGLERLTTRTNKLKVDLDGFFYDVTDSNGSMQKGLPKFDYSDFQKRLDEIILVELTKFIEDQKAIYQKIYDEL